MTISISLLSNRIKQKEILVFILWNRVNKVCNEAHPVPPTVLQLL